MERRGVRTAGGGGWSCEDSWRRVEVSGQVEGRSVYYFPTGGTVLHTYIPHTGCGPYYVLTICTALPYEEKESKQEESPPHTTQES